MLEQRKFLAAQSRTRYMRVRVQLYTHTAGSEFASMPGFKQRYRCTMHHYVTTLMPVKSVCHGRKGRMGSLELTEESTLLGFIIQTAQNDRAGRWNFLHIPRVCILNRQG